MVEERELEMVEVGQPLPLWTRRGPCGMRALMKLVWVVSERLVHNTP